MMTLRRDSVDGRGPLPDSGDEEYRPSISVNVVRVMDGGAEARVKDFRTGIGL